MNHKILWTLSLLTICIIVIIWTVCNFAGIDLPDMAVRIMGIIDLCAIPVLIYQTHKSRSSPNLRRFLKITLVLDTCYYIKAKDMKKASCYQ